MMKIFLALTLFIFSQAYAATCTTTSRTNYTTGQVLTSTALNADLNQLVTKANALDGGCVTDGTLEASSLNSTDFAAVTNGIHQGCAVSYSDTNTVSVGKCILSVNGNFVKTATASTVTWGCTSCSAEVVSTQYYVYAKTGSTGTTLNLLISTTAPNGDGYDGSGNKILGKFYNNSSGNIEQFFIYNWNTGIFLNNKETFTFSYGTTNFATVCSADPCSFLDQIGGHVSSVAWGATGQYTINLYKTFSKIKCIGNAGLASGIANMTPLSIALNSSTVNMVTRDSAWNVANSFGTVYCEGY